MANEKNKIRVSAPSSTQGLQISVPDTKRVIEATNNRSQYFADLARKYRDEAKEHRDNAKYYAEQNSDVTIEYINNIQSSLEAKISTKQDLGDYALKNELPIKVSELENDSEYIDKEEFLRTVDEVRLPEQQGCEGMVLSSDGVSEAWVDIQALTENQITNCILEIPQNINLELNDGTLTLKAGSKVIVPNGFEADGTTPKFDEVIIDEDINNSNQTSNQTWFMCYNTNVKYTNVRTVIASYSGPTQPTSTALYQAWYDTANNLMKFTSDSGATWQEGLSLPICICTSSNDASYTSVDQVFNGFGYVGLTVFCHKGVKILTPNGRNADGTLNNREYTTDTVKLLHIGWNNGLEYLSLTHNGSFQAARYFVAQDEKPNLTGVIWYNTRENIVYRIAASGVMSKTTEVVVCTCNRERDGKVNALEQKLPFRAVDYNDFSKSIKTLSKAYITETYVSGTSGYNVYSNGYCEQWGRTSAKEGLVTITLLKTFKDTNYSVLTTGLYPSGETNNGWDYVRNITATSFGIYQQSGGCMWKACGYIA